MGIMSMFASGGLTSAVTAVTGLIDDLHTSDEEKAAAEIVKQRLLQEPGKAQAAINQVEAGHRSMFVAGWRPFIGWVCGSGLAYAFIGNPALQWFTGEPGPELPTEAMISLVMSLLGLGALRTFEKATGRAK